MQAGLASVICIAVAAATRINHNIITYWPKFEWVSWGVGTNKARATKRHKKKTSKLYFLVWIGNLSFGYIVQHKCKHGATAT